MQDNLKTINKKIKTLQKRLSPLYDNRNKITQEISLKKDKKLIGKCFTFKNSGGYENKTWPCFYKVVGVRDYGLVILELQFYPDDTFLVQLSEDTKSFIKYNRQILSKTFDKKLNNAITNLQALEA